MKEKIVSSELYRIIKEKYLNNITRERVYNTLKKTAIAGGIFASSLGVFVASANGYKLSEDQLEALLNEKSKVVADIREEESFLDWFNNKVSTLPNEVQQTMTSNDYVWENATTILGDCEYTDRISEINEDIEEATHNKKMSSLGLILSSHIAMPSGMATMLMPIEIFDKEDESEEEMAN